MFDGDAFAFIGNADGGFMDLQRDGGIFRAVFDGVIQQIAEHELDE